MAARKTRFLKRTPEAEKKILDAMKMGASYRLACDYAGISTDTLERWREDDAAFAERLRVSRAEGAMSWLLLIEKTAKAGDWRAAQWKLQVAYPDDYAERSRVQVEHSGSVDVNILAEIRAAVERAFPDDPDAPIRITEALRAIEAPKDKKERAS